jgi:orotate phosphoribosyltransferase
MITEREVLAIFERNNAFLTGHFRLSSGLHSQKYLQCALILQHPEIAQGLARELASRFQKDAIDFVIGPALGGVVLSYEMARQLKCRSIYTEREDNKMALRRGFAINPGERGLIVEDVVTTGGSIAEVIKLIEGFNGKVAGIATLIDRSSGIDFGVKFGSLAKVKIETFAQDSCPLCKVGLSIVKPGSRK